MSPGLQDPESRLPGEPGTGSVWWLVEWPSCPQALPALALQALGRGARGVWVQLCPPGRPGGPGEEALVWPSPVHKLPSRVQWELLLCT